MHKKNYIGILIIGICFLINGFIDILKGQNLFPGILALLASAILFFSSFLLHKNNQ
ncbi:MAG: hypothetical protein PUE01_10245 [Clostridiaceae bacterium]|nr:hypothetical protein [Clostridiaceae bacterium]